MARRMADGPTTAITAGLLALIVLAGFFGLTLTADRLLREIPGRGLLTPRVLTSSPDLDVSAATLRRVVPQPPPESPRRPGGFVRVAAAAVSAASGVIGPVLSAAALPTPVAIAASAIESSSTSVTALDDKDSGDSPARRATRKAKAKKSSASGSRAGSETASASSNSEKGPKDKEKGAPANAGGAKKRPDGSK